MNIEKEEIHDLICKKHNQKIQMIIIAAEGQFSDYRCSECLQERLNILKQVDDSKTNEREIMQPRLNKIQECKNQFIKKASCIKRIILKLLRNNRTKKYSMKLVSEQVEQPRQLIQESEEWIKEPKKIKFVNTIYKTGFCSTIAFNKTSSLMLVGRNKQVQIWQFNKRKLLKQLSGHTSDVLCIVFSKRLNWFVSCCRNMIIGWKQQGSDWVSSKAQEYNSNFTEIILNNNEKELISSSSFDSLIVWNVDQEQKITLKYKLGSFSRGVNRIALNQSETSLVLYIYKSGEIILMKKGLDGEWHFESEIKVYDGNRLCFISETEIFFQPCYYNKIHLFTIEKNTLVELKNHNANFRVSSCDNGFFQTIYNKKRQMIILKYGFDVYMIKKKLDGSFQIILSRIDCLDYRCYGSITEDGEYLVIYYTKLDQIRVYKIQY